MKSRKTLGIALALGGALVIVFVLARGFYFGSGSGDAGIPANASKAEIISAESLTAEEADLKPVRLEIPKIGVNSHVQHLGITSSGLMAVPSNFTDVGWYKYGPVPGKSGSSVIAGHQDNAMGTPAVFFKLDRLDVGDRVYVTREDGKRLEFRVRKIETVPYNLRGAKLEEIFHGRGGKYLNLITCAGDWLPSAKTNDLRLIVYTELVE